MTTNWTKIINHAASKLGIKDSVELVRLAKARHPKLMEKDALLKLYAESIEEQTTATEENN